MYTRAGQIAREHKQKGVAGQANQEKNFLFKINWL